MLIGGSDVNQLKVQYIVCLLSFKGWVKVYLVGWHAKYNTGKYFTYIKYANSRFRRNSLTVGNIQNCWALFSANNENFKFLYIVNFSKIIHFWMFKNSWKDPRSNFCLLNKSIWPYQLPISLNSVYRLKRYLHPL